MAKTGDPIKDFHEHDAWLQRLAGDESDYVFCDYCKERVSSESLKECNGFACHAKVCPECITRCVDCNEPMCPECLDDTDRCDSCCIMISK